MIVVEVYPTGRSYFTCPAAIDAACSRAQHGFVLGHLAKVVHHTIQVPPSMTCMNFHSSPSSRLRRIHRKHVTTGLSRRQPVTSDGMLLPPQRSHARDPASNDTVWARPSSSVTTLPVTSLGTYESSQCGRCFGLSAMKHRMHVAGPATTDGSAHTMGLRSHHTHES